MESSGSSTLNPATDVNLRFSTFNLANTDQAPDTLSHTRFGDYYPGIEPSGVDNTPTNQQTVEEVRRHIDRFIGATPAEDGKSYTKVRNPLDLINQVISVGQVANFDEGRNYIRNRIAEGQAGNYNTRSADAMIRFVDQEAENNQAPLNNREWYYQTLDWRYLPKGPDNNNLDEKVYRTAQYVARSVSEDQQAKQPELVSVLAGSRFNALSFASIGYNQPELATADFVSRNYGGIELRQEFVGEAQKDTLFIKNSEQQVVDLSRHGVILEDTSPDCLRVELNYAMNEVRIYTSNEEPSRVPDPNANPADYDSPEDVPTVANPANCVNQADDNAVVWWSASASADRK
ncbi:hypothetical protein [Marinobacter sp. SS5-14b]|uniref:hypothetical protein n=1 Tax=Marinobacter sp. SS5-14b TaxID=3050456 RepID=UPI0026E0945B|nr:hypothetical protein [Marinobacter sp. SS5-14b]